MRYSSRFFLYAPLAVVLVIAVGIMTWWKIASDRLDERLAAANGHEIMPGVAISYAAKSTGGFPFGLDTELDGFTLQIQTRTGPLVWRAEHFAIHALTYGRNQQIFEAAGVQTVSWTDSDGAHRVFTFVPGSLRASAIKTDARLSRFDLDAVAVNTSNVVASQIQFHIRRHPDTDALDVNVSASDLAISSSGPLSSRGNIDDRPMQLTMQGELLPASPLNELLQGKADWRNSAESWRESGGRLNIDRVALQDMERTIWSGQLSLDDQHRLHGRVVEMTSARSGRGFVFDQGHLMTDSRQLRVVVSPLY